MSRTGKTYTEEFRRNAVELLRSSGRPVSHVARELGVDVNSLRACTLAEELFDPLSNPSLVTKGQGG